MTHDLDVCIAARNEEWLARTLEDLFQHAELDTHAIVTLDGYWPNPPLLDHPKVTLIHHTNPVGQRRGYNEAVQLSRARFVMKIDAHTALDQGFDRKLIEPYDKGELAATDVTVARMYNLWAFSWVCPVCKHTTYQGPTPAKCQKEGCDGVPQRDIKWIPRPRTHNDLWWFDNKMHVWYCRGSEHQTTWDQWNRRAATQGDIIETMACMGNCWIMTRERHHALGGLDEGHGSWGQVGVEVGCKSWLSGGRLVTNKRTWFAHLFRTQGGDFGFPYQISGNDQERAKEYSRWLWKGGHWVGAKRPLTWLVEHFSPVPTWDAAEKAA